ncbi:helix-turn-helix transcriptional regulator [Longimycelium tulufanense]|uniref:helix-turn-helix transcriptional regulator n=1 Tax=Longimycelium tulufanense TaxID=907463 RepID=UPI001E3CDC10|nr:LuxR family transcriptional regulator [Longimycelium tulufanense]
MARLGSGIPLVGRGRELGVLRSALDRARGGLAGAVLIAGDAGIGKSRLLTELTELATAGGAQVLAGRCVDAGETGLPYLPFADALGRVPVAQLAQVRTRPALARLLPDVLAGDHPTDPPPARPDEDLGQLQLFDAVRGLLTELSARRCVVLALEDLHWADASTRHLLSFLLSRLHHQRLLVVATYRSDDLHRKHPLRPLLAEVLRLPTVERLDLAPLGPDAAEDFVRALSADTLDENDVREIARRSEGIPFFAEELVATHAVGRDLPATLSDVLLNRIERLPSLAQRVVRLASVAGRRVKHAKLRAVCELEDAALEEALREAVTHHVLVAGDGAEFYRFRHALLQEAVYADLLPGERVRIHAAYARLLANEQGVRGAAAELAYHSIESHDLPTALTASVRAAGDAASARAPAEALRHLEQALDLWSAVADPAACAGVQEVELLRKAAYYAGVSGQPERALAFVRAAVEMVDEDSDPEQAADLRRRAAQELLTVDGRFAEAEREIGQAWALVRAKSASASRAWVLAVKVRVDVIKGEDRAARGWAESALADAEQVGAAGAAADALTSLALLDQRQGDLEAACVRLAGARDRAAAAHAFVAEMRAWFQLAANRYEQGNVDAAIRLLREAVRRAEDTGMSWSNYGLELHGLLMTALFAAGEWEDSVALTRSGEALVPDVVSVRLLAHLLQVLVARGEFGPAAELLRKLRPARTRDLHVALIHGASGAEMALWRDRPKDAVGHVTDAIELLRESDGMELSLIRLAALGVAAHADLAARARRRRDTAGEQAAVVAGEASLEQAREIVRTVRPRTGVLGPEGHAWLARAEAETARLAGADDAVAWARTVELFAGFHRYHEALARWRWARALLAAGDRDTAQEQLRLAHTAAEHLRAVPLGDAVRGLARRARINLAGGNGAIGNPIGPREALDPLTPRERAVLRLVALGRTNRQIGGELFISEKTVSVHLSRVMAKLGASSRTEAVALAYDRGLLTGSP